MGLITGLLTLPLAPVRGVIWVAEKSMTPPIASCTTPPYCAVSWRH